MKNSLSKFDLKSANWEPSCFMLSDLTSLNRKRFIKVIGGRVDWCIHFRLLTDLICDTSHNGVKCNKNNTVISRWFGDDTIYWHLYRGTLWHTHTFNPRPWPFCNTPPGLFTISLHCKFSFHYKQLKQLRNMLRVLFNWTIYLTRKRIKSNQFIFSYWNSACGVLDFAPHTSSRHSWCELNNLKTWLSYFWSNISPLLYVTKFEWKLIPLSRLFWWISSS